MAAREDFQEGMLVINEKTNRRGTIVPDRYGVCAAHEIPVQYDGERGYAGTDWRDLCLFDLD